MMQLPFFYLRDHLQNSGISRIYGDPQPDFPMGRPRFYCPGQPLEAGRLYVSEPLSEPPSLPAATALLTASHVPALFNQIQELYDRCEAWEDTLRSAADTGDMRELLDEIETILNNPILLHKSNYSIVTCSAEIYSNETLLPLRGSHLPYDYVNALQRDPHHDAFCSTQSVFFCQTPVSAAPVMSINLLPEGEIGYRLTVIPLFHPLSDSDQFLLTLCARFVCRMLQSTVIAGRSDDPTGRRERLMGLYRIGVENENTDQIVLEQGFSALGWLAAHQYCCLSIQIGTPDPANYAVELLCNQLESRLPASCMFAHLGSIAVLVNLSLAGASIREVLEKNRYFFRDNDLRCGISNVFTGFSQLRNFHRQSHIAMGFASRPQTYLWTQYFSDIVLDYILEQSNRELPLHLICSPQVLQLKQYDAEHQTQFYETLESYIQNKFNAVQTAKDLQIHRSTFLYRMERLQTLFGLDLSQRNSLLYILLSMKMLESSKTMNLHE